MDYGEDTGESSSKRYIAIGLITLVICIYLYYKGYLNNRSRVGNIILIYVTIMFLNYTNSNAFIRFANFISFIATIEFIELFIHKNIRQLSYIMMGAYMILNLQLTLGRTISGGYCSSYMDNSIFKILTSNVWLSDLYCLYNLRNDTHIIYRQKHLQNSKWCRRNQQAEYFHAQNNYRRQSGFYWARTTFG